MKIQPTGEDSMTAVTVERAPKNYSTLLAEVRGVLEADRAKYGEKILSHLEEEIGLSQTLLGEIHLFYRSFPISPARGKLDLPWPSVTKEIKSVGNGPVF